MITVNIRDLTHNFASYLKEVKFGERVTILERNVPVADIIPHNENVAVPGWKRNIKRIKVKGESFSTTVARSRAEGR